MAGMGPLPDENSRRNKYNAPTLPTDALDAAGYTGEVPDPVNALTAPEREYYDWAWSTPAACAWHWSDAEIVADWARLKHLADRYQRGQVFKGDAPAELPSALLTQITAREDRLYLSPMARKKGRTAMSDATTSPRGATKRSGGGQVVRPERWQSA